MVPSRPRRPDSEPTHTVFPAQLRVGDCFTDNDEEWEVVEAPSTRTGGSREGPRPHDPAVGAAAGGPRHRVTDRRRALLVAALGFARVDVRPEPPELRVLRAWLSSWAGIGAIVTGMVRQGFDVDLMSLGPGRWQTTFLAANPIGGAPVAAGYAEAPMPGAAVQRAAWAALHHPLLQRGGAGAGEP